MESEEFVVINVPIRRKTLEKLKRIAEFENLKNEFKQKDRTYRTEIDVAKGAIVKEIERIETFNHFITFNGEKSLGNKKYALKNRLKEVLKEKKMKQLDLCEMTGIDRSNMSMIANNRNQPSADYLLRIWVALDFHPLEEIFYRVESE